MQERVTAMIRGKFIVLNTERNTKNQKPKVLPQKPRKGRTNQKQPKQKVNSNFKSINQ